MTKYQNLQGLKVFNQNLPFLLQNPQFFLLSRPSEILLKSSILCSKKSRRVEIFLKSKIFLKLNMLKSKNYCNDFASDTDKILGGGGGMWPSPRPWYCKSNGKNDAVQCTNYAVNVFRRTPSVAAKMIDWWSKKIQI